MLAHTRSTLGVLSYVMKPKPRGFRVWGSHMMTQSVTRPYVSKYVMNSSSLVSCDRPPTKILSSPALTSRPTGGAGTGGTLGTTGATSAGRARLSESRGTAGLASTSLPSIK